MLRELDEFAKDLDFCSACPRLCQSACPVLAVSGNESVSPWGLMQTMNQVRKGELPFDAEVAALSYQCLTCKACTSRCEHEIEIPPVMHAVRSLAVKQEIAPPEINGFLGKFHRHNNPFSKDLLHKLKQILPEKYFAGERDVVYYASCTTICKTPDVVQGTFELFEKLKIDFVGIFPETIQCCGYPLMTAGMEAEFEDLAEINFHALKKYKTIVCGSPACVYTLRETYKKFSFNLGTRIVTINEFLEPYLQNINYKIKKNIRTKIMYHDPCYLSRYLGEVELPREMIAQVSGTEPIEFFENREKGMCSGQGGCYSVVAKDTSEKITQKHLEEVYEKQVQTVVTQCPSCIHKFRKNSKGLIIKDLVSYLNDCIESVQD